MPHREDSPNFEDSLDWLQSELERACAVFEAAFQGSSHADLGQFLVGRADLDERRREVLLAELVKLDMDYRWRRAALETRIGTGEDATKEQRPVQRPAIGLNDYAARFPELRITADLVLEEFELRRRHGDLPDVGAYLSRYPHLVLELQRMLPMLAGDQLTSRDSQAIEADPTTLPGESPARPPQTGAGEQPGDLVGRYRVERFLGEGAFGRVLLAQDPELARPVVLKVARPQLAQGDAVQRELLREARLAATIRHPGIVSIYDIVFAGGRCAIVMEFVEGASLADLLARKTLRRPAGLELLIEVCEAVHAAHTAGLIHRDLKPANILVDPQGRPRVADFGLAVQVDDRARAAWSVSGSPAYMAPEQIRGESHRLDGRTDLWAIGIMLYELLVGRRPFSGATTTRLFEETLYREPRPPRQADDSIDAELERICLKCLGKAMADRFTTVRDLAMELRKHLRLSRLHSGSRRGLAPHPISALAAHKGNLPAAADACIGREEELSRLAETFRGGRTGLITIVGPAGMGKSRLALEAARQLAGDFSGGCWLVDVSSAATPEAICRAVLVALGVTSDEDLSHEEYLLQVLALREPLLLVLDGYGQAADQATPLVRAILEQAPQVRLLITGGQRMGLAGEQVVSLAGLSVPPPGAISAAALAANPSVQLLVEAARRSGAQIDVAAEAPRLIRVCRQLEGIPLAIELAASRLSVLTLAQLEQRANQRFQLLRSTRKDLPDRQRTMWAAIEASCELLGPAERAVLIELSRFPGSFDLEAAEAAVSIPAACAAEEGAGLVIDIVQSLRERSLLSCSDLPGGRRFTMLRTIREFCREQRSSAAPAAPAADDFWPRLAAHLTPLAGAWSQRLQSCERAAARAWFAEEAENLEALRQWAIEQRRGDRLGEITLACDPFLAHSADSNRRIESLQAASAMAQGIPAIRLLLCAADAWQVVGTLPKAEQSARQALALSEQAAQDGNSAAELPRLAAEALLKLATIDRLAGRIDAARSNLAAAERRGAGAGELALERGLLCRLRGEWDAALAEFELVQRAALAGSNELLAAAALRNCSHILARLGRFAEARAGLSRALEIAQAAGDRRQMHLTLTSLGMVSAELGEFAPAVDCYTQALAIAAELGQRRAMATNRGNRGLAWADLGRLDDAVAELLAAEALNRELGNQAGLALNLANRGAALVGLGRLDEAAPLLEQARQLQQQQQNRDQEAQVRADLGWLYFLRGEPALAAEHLQAAAAEFAALKLADTPDGFLVRVQLACVLNALGRGDECQALAQQCRVTADALRLSTAHPRVRIRDACLRLEELQR